MTRGAGNTGLTNGRRTQSCARPGRFGPLAAAVGRRCEGAVSSAANVRELLLPLLLLFTLSAHAETLTGTVVSVADGDTITVLDGNHEQHRIRVSGIDAPEKAQPFGQRSKESMSAMVFGNAVDVQWHKLDRYQRIVGKVMVQPSDCPTCPKTLDAGLAQLTVGLAWWYHKYAREQSPEDAGRYEFAEYEARAKRAGLWADGHPVPPWEWRKGERISSAMAWMELIDSMETYAETFAASFAADAACDASTQFVAICPAVAAICSLAAAALEQRLDATRDLSAIAAADVLS